jgi:hypothetical protein
MAKHYRGNSNIGRTGHYAPAQRKAVRQHILQEFQAHARKFPNGGEFVRHLKTSLNKAGLKRPDGRPFDEKAVRAQVRFAGISFRDTFHSLPLEKKAALMDEAPQTAKQEGVGLHPFARTIMDSPLLTDEQKLAQLKTLLG